MMEEWNDVKEEWKNGKDEKKRNNGRMEDPLLHAFSPRNFRFFKLALIL
jgi:hypothetical protein